MGNPYKSRFRLDSLQHVLYTDSYDLEYTFIAQLDTLETETTCTVTMAETIPGMLRMHAWQKTDSVGVDTIIVSVAESLFLTRYSTAMAPCDTYIEKAIHRGFDRRVRAQEGERHVGALEDGRRRAVLLARSG